MNRHGRRRAKAIGLGPTGDFPRGKLSEDDEGGLRIAILHREKTVLMNFGNTVAWIGLDVKTAKQLAEAIIHHASEADAGL